MRYPPLRYYLEKVMRDMGGISHWAAKRRLRFFVAIAKLLQVAQGPLNGGGGGSNGGSFGHPIDLTMSPVFTPMCV